MNPKNLAVITPALDKINEEAWKVGILEEMYKAQAEAQQPGGAPEGEATAEGVQLKAIMWKT